MLLALVGFEMIICYLFVCNAIGDIRMLFLFLGFLRKILKLEQHTGGNDRFVYG